ncbi:MAG: MBL fold metallo-hydrolase [Synergistaceae bacterium]|jgi:glyoxylase-like metal-dependent hydrolase (beta-lactamase superfamily II)|nr:MBL fold metallo-hydrolase [Synergistaceae bacterium]
MRCALLVCAFFAVSFLLSGGAAWGEAKVRRFTVGSGEEATVWAVADSTDDRDMSVFMGLGPDVLRKYVPSGFSPSATMAFLVRTGGETILIDAGLGEPSGARASQLPDGLSQIGAEPGDVTLILLTHLHRDHIGGLIREDGQKAFPSARVLSSRVEHGFWFGQKTDDPFPDRGMGFNMARQVMGAYAGRVLGAYAGAEDTFDFDTAIAPGIQALDARGHTPGHTAFLLECGGEKLLFWGDLVHAAALQFLRPDINAVYDMNPGEAAAARVRFMERAAIERLLVAGSHLPFPGVGAVEKIAPGSYLCLAR